jgi:glutathione S-transferase
MQPVEIFGIPQSNYVRAVRMVCEEKAIDYELRPVRPQSPEALALHPLGKVPGMRHGTVELAESRAIAAYLERLSPKNPLMPQDPLLALQAEQWISLVNTAVDRTMIRDFVLGYVFPKGPNGEPDHAAIRATVPIMENQIAVLDKAVSKTGHLVGEQFTYADINLLTILASIQRYDEGRKALSNAAHLTRYFQRHSARPSFQKTAPPPS